jgi:hypothetical protein
MDRTPLFLLEHNDEQATVADLTRIHRAFAHAVARLGERGIPVRIVSAVFVRDQARCLYVVEATAAEQVVEALDIAGLLNGVVRPAVRLEDVP